MILNSLISWQTQPVYRVAYYAAYSLAKAALPYYRLGLKKIPSQNYDVILLAALPYYRLGPENIISYI